MSHRVAAEPFAIAVVSPGALRIAERLLASAGHTSRATAGVVGDRHLEGDRRGPEAVVFGRRQSLAAREFIEQHALEPDLLAVLELLHRVVHPGGGDDPHGEETIGRDGGVLLGQILVVGPVQRQVTLVVVHPANEAAHAGEENLGLDAILVLLGETPLGATRATGALERGDLIVEMLAWNPDAAGEADPQWAAVADDDRVRPVGQANLPRRLLPPLARHMLLPQLRRKVKV